jgi:uncharacterized protein (TIGR02996 family)
MTDGQLLLKAIVADPKSDEPRLQYADYLRENGDADRAEFIEVQIKLLRGNFDCRMWMPNCGECGDGSLKFLAENGCEGCTGRGGS